MKKIALDIGGVLIEDIWENIFFNYIHTKYNIDINLLNTIGMELWHKYSILSEDENDNLEIKYWQEVIEKLDLDSSVQEFIDITDQYIIKVHSMELILPFLKDKHIDIFIFSNTTSFWLKRIKHILDFDKYVKPNNYIVSCEVGEEKEKNLKMFEELLRKADGNINLLVDDRKSNIETALQYNIPSILFPSASKYGYQYIKYFLNKLLQ